MSEFSTSWRVGLMENNLKKNMKIPDLRRSVRIHLPISLPGGSSQHENFHPQHKKFGGNIMLRSGTF